ncbi:hypothetical protein [Carboxylicivirga sp. M1479]|uniref:hypothetical protein n=1 Tax=Carboxylicivirga sp. M1479 TaxID=2594476 RepID=UPI00117886AF|nr:hypothetical protein [Carboxylicivirga sp. M1479]TRX65936.1 hypothetical protein FNN09_16215 [Carboxylicivirga sp. M1479]
MIIALLIKLLLGGGQDDFLIPPIEKYCKKHLDESSKNIVIETLDKHEDDSKEFFKNFETEIKEFQKKRMAGNVSESEFDVFYSINLKGHKTLDSLSLTRHFIIVDQFTEKQWQDALTDIDKTLKRQQKSFEKKRSKLNKRINKLHNKVEKHINKHGMNPSARLIVASFEEHLNRTLDEFSEKQKERNALLINYNTKQSEVIQLNDDRYAIRMAFNMHFKKTYFDLKNILTKNEWQMISKQFNSVL